MKHNYLTNIPLNEAISNYLSRLSHIKQESIEILVEEALGRTTSSAVYAAQSVPHYNSAAMDGFALSAKDTFGATQTTPITLKTGYAFVDTGDLLPEGCDCVVMIEDVVEKEFGIQLYNGAYPWQHVRQIGEDICAGDMLFPSYSVITAAGMGAMIASGVSKVSVVKPCLVGIIPTGDELTPSHSNPKEGEIREFNSIIFSALLEGWGAHSKTYPIVVDSLDLIQSAIQTALEECDVVIINAGSSAGRDDWTKTAIENLGEAVIHGIAIKPGKPTILGLVGGKPVIGVPGYPVSGIIVMNEIVRKVIALLQNNQIKQPPVISAHMGKKVVSSLKYQEFLRVNLCYINDKYVAAPLSRGAGIVTSFVKADAIVEIPQNTEGFETGDIVEAKLLRSEEDIRKTICIMGSHDPLIDELINFTRLKNSNTYISSTHVGSMGAVMALRRSEAHMGAVHLLDVNDGSYNVSYVNRYFNKGDVQLVECVSRTQGFIVQPGNPLGIKSLQDIIQKELSYINRQKGSGTRILLDYLLEKENILPDSIYGYTREEFTHTAVAAQIAFGDGDVGLGVYSAAKIYGLDFVPVAQEEYDLLIKSSSMDLPDVRLLLDTLASAEFAARLEQMGGYTLGRPGRIKELI